MPARNLAENLWYDLRYAIRLLRRSPGFSAITILSLALGIGANTAVFSLINTLMLRLLPVEEPRQLVEFLQHYPGEPRGNGFWSWTSYEHYRDQNHTLSGLIAFSTPSRVRVDAAGFETENMTAESVSGNFFTVLGLKPAIGRLLGPDDVRTGGTAVVSWTVWKERFNLSSMILGRRVTVHDVPATIVGVTPAGFDGFMTGSRTDVWVPIAPSPAARLALVGRLKPGTSIEATRAEMAVLFQFTIEERTQTSKDPLIRQMKVEVEPAGAAFRSCAIAWLSRCLC
ncbi:MAG TPA: ABC transporter permease [Bryobacteraceae bacterium]|nr:ABC transporter permease [Bryobacteraceae bacterium]